jgi:hypothetical protein
MIAASYLTETRLNCVPCNILEAMEPLKAEVDEQQVGFYYQLMTTASDYVIVNCATNYCTAETCY